MRQSLRSGFSFGLTSGVITTLGLVVGLYSGTRSVQAVIGGIITIAVADALSDALGMHIREESQSRHSQPHVWLATVSTLVAKFVTAATFLIPIGLLPLEPAVWASVVWGLLVITVLSWRLARDQGIAPWGVIGEHLTVAVVVVALTHWLGVWVAENVA